MATLALARRFALIAVRADAQRAPPQQRDGAAGIAPVRVRQPHRDLREPLPQVAFARRARFPRRLEHLVRVKRASRPQQLIGQPGRVRPGEREVAG